MSDAFTRLYFKDIILFTDYLIIINDGFYRRGNNLFAFITPASFKYKISVPVIFVVK